MECNFRLYQHDSERDLVCGIFHLEQHQRTHFGCAECDSCCGKQRMERYQRIYQQYPECYFLYSLKHLEQHQKYSHNCDECDQDHSLEYLGICKIRSISEDLLSSIAKYPKV